jgi:hypothetical protein
VHVTVPVFGHDEQSAFGPQPPLFTVQGTTKQGAVFVTANSYMIVCLQIHLTPVPVPEPVLRKPGLHVHVTVPVIGHDEQSVFEAQPPLFTVQGATKQRTVETHLRELFFCELTDTSHSSSCTCASTDETRLAFAGDRTRDQT